MKIKNILLILLCCSFLLTGCGGKQNNIDSTNPPDTINPEIGETSPSAPIYILEDIKEIEIDEYLWEKEYATFDQNCVELTKDWKEKIIVGKSTISALTFTDISIVPNYFIKDDNVADIETAYNVQKKGFEVNRESVMFGDYIKGSLSLIATTWGKNLIVEEVRFIVNANPYAGGLDDLKANAKYNGTVGAGSTYEDVIKMLGNPTSEDVIPMMEGYEQINVMYDTDNVNLTLIFVKDASGNKNQGLLTTIYWRADALREIINTQVVS